MPDPDSCLAARTPASAWMPLKSFNGSSFPNGVRAGRIGGCGGGGRRRSSLGRAATVKQTSGVPQGRVLRPRLFTAPLSAAGGIPTAGAVAPAAITGRSMALSMIPRRAREQFLAAPISPCRFALYSTVCTLCAGSYAGNTRREDQRKKRRMRASAQQRSAKLKYYGGRCLCLHFLGHESRRKTNMYASPPV